MHMYGDVSLLHGTYELNLVSCFIRLIGSLAHFLHKFIALMCSVLIWTLRVNITSNLSMSKQQTIPLPLLKIICRVSASYLLIIILSNIQKHDTRRLTPLLTET